MNVYNSTNGDIRLFILKIGIKAAVSQKCWNKSA